jgi:hypothetical protein
VDEVAEELPDPAEDGVPVDGGADAELPVEAAAVGAAGGVPGGEPEAGSPAADDSRGTPADAAVDGAPAPAIATGCDPSPAFASGPGLAMGGDPPAGCVAPPVGPAVRGAAAVEAAGVRAAGAALELDALSGLAAAGGFGGTCIPFSRVASPQARCFDFSFA